MVKKSVLAIIITAVFSIAYIFAIEKYSQIPDDMERIYERITFQNISKEGAVSVDNTNSLSDSKNITYYETGFKMNAVVYNETLSLQDMINKAYRMSEALSHDENCSRLCMASHNPSGFIENIDVDKGIGIKYEGEDERAKYVFTIKNQKDTNYNTYYKLEVTGNMDHRYISSLKFHAEKLFQKWKLNQKEFFYFKGVSEGKSDFEKMENISDTIMTSLNARRTNFFVNDAEKSTCSYYGYCKGIKEYYKEANGDKSNMQIAFNYDEVKKATDIVVAFPFYNEAF